MVVADRGKAADEALPQFDRQIAQHREKYIDFSAIKINFSLAPPRPLCYTCTR